MRAKELRLALVCYGGISLAVYMHGVTKELWRLARASRGWHAGEPAEAGTEGVYAALLADLEAAGARLSVLVDIVAGASAGGINGLFLAQAIATGQSLEPLTRLWLDSADVDVLLAPNPARLSGVGRLWAAPLAWMAAGRKGGVLERTVEPAVRDEVRAKLTRFLGARPFQPPFSGDGFTDLLFDSFDAMAATAAGPPLLPPEQPLDLFVTVTDFNGHPERLRLHSPPEVVETEHRLTIAFGDRGTAPRRLGDIAELVFAARATASFPGAFPPFAVAELDRALARRRRPWPGRDAFLARTLPRHAAVGAIDAAILIDGSVLANAPFRPCIDALKDRPAGREVDRRFVYVDPKPGIRSVRLSGSEPGALPGFFRTIFGALSDIPREQPIRDNLEALAARSEQVARTRALVAAIRPEVEAAIEASLGGTFFLDRPSGARLASWRAKANTLAARQAGYAYASYGRLKLASVEEELATLLSTLSGAGTDTLAIEAARRDVAAAVAAAGLDDPRALAATGASEDAIRFFRAHDLGFRIRRLRFLAAELEDGEAGDAQEALRDAVYRALGRYLDREQRAFFGPDVVRAAGRLADAPAAALDAVAAARDLRGVDDAADAMLAGALDALPRASRRAPILLYLGFAFYDVATLPLLGAAGRDEFNPVRVDRIAPDDASAIRAGGAEATLKGIQFNSFGAFFSRAYRENDYLWGRLHGADRLIDIVVSALPRGIALAPGRVAALKQQAFRAILAEERGRLTAIPELFVALDGEIG